MLGWGCLESVGGWGTFLLLSVCCSLAAWQVSVLSEDLPIWFVLYHCCGATLVVGGSGDASGLLTLALWCHGCRDSAYPSKLVQLCVHTSTFPFCQRVIWIPLKDKNELEALQSHLPMAIVTVQREVCATG